MPRCAGCSSTDCNCFIDAGTGITITGDGSSGDHFVINAAGGGGGEGAFATVAAFDTYEPFKSNATYICTGVSDQDTINFALESFRFVLLLPGTFNISDTIDVDQDDYPIAGTAPGDSLPLTLAGCGMGATIIRATTGFDVMDVYEDGTTVRDFTVIRIDNGPGLEVFGTALIERVSFQTEGAGLFEFQALTTWNPWTIVRNCEFTGDCDDAVIRINDTDSLVEGCSISSILQDPSGNSIEVNDDRCQVINNRITSTGSIFIAGTNVIVSGNIINEVPQHGIHMQNAIECIINGNIVENAGFSVDNTYDGVFLDGNSDANSIQGNLIRRGAAPPQTRYGINISAATCDDNFVTNNDLLESGATASFNDAGTGTITAPGNRL